MKAVLLSLLFVSSSVLAQDAPLYKDPAQPVDARVADLLARMTSEEKVAQLLCIWEDKNELLDDDGRFVAAKAATALPYGLGHVARPSDNR